MWETLSSHTTIPFAHRVGTSLAPDSSALGFFFELPLTSRFAHSYKPFKVGKKHLLSAHPLENQTQNKHLQCAWMLWNAREGQQGPESALPSPYGESGFAGSILEMAAGNAARPSASSTLPHPPWLPGSTRPSYRPHPPAVSFLCSQFPPTSSHLAGCSLCSSECPELSPWPSDSSPSLLRPVENAAGSQLSGPPMSPCLPDLDLQESQAGWHLHTDVS